MSDIRIPQNPGIGGLNELTTDEEAIVQAINAGTYFVDNETPSGTINGSNKTFTLASTPNPSSSLHLYVNGMRMKGGGDDYSLSGGTITMTIAPPSGSTLLVDYRVDPT